VREATSLAEGERASPARIAATSLAEGEHVPVT
jgi:hypothetical protein